MAESTRRILPLALAVALATTACGSDTTEPEGAAQEAPVQERARAAPARPANTPPSIRRIRFEPENPAPGDTVGAVVEATDAEGDALRFHYEWRIGDEPAGTSEKLALHRLAKGETVEVRVVANDGVDESAPERAWVELRNRSPEIRELHVEPGREVMTGTPIVVQPDARDLDGDEFRFRYEWKVNGRTRRNDSPRLETERLRRGDEIQLRVVASDGEDDSEAVDAPAMVIVNSPPRVVSTPPSAFDGGVFLYRVVAEDPDGSSGIRFQLDDRPEGMDIEPRSGLIRWTPKADQAGSHSVTVVAEDRQGAQGRHEFELTVSEAVSVPAASAP